MNLPGLSLLGYDSLVTQWGPLEQARRPKEVEQEIREAEEHIAALREAIKGGAGSLPDFRTAYDSALKVVHGIGSTYPRWGRQIADKLYNAVSSGNEVRSLAEELRDMGIHEPRISPLPRKGGYGGGHSAEDRAAWEEHRAEFLRGLPDEVQQHETPKKPKKLYDTPGGKTLIDIMAEDPGEPEEVEKKAESGPSTFVANSKNAPAGYTRPGPSTADDASASGAASSDDESSEGEPQKRATFRKKEDGPASIAAPSGDSDRDKRIRDAYDRLISDEYKGRRERGGVNAESVFFSGGESRPVAEYKKKLGNLYTSLTGDKVSRTTWGRILSGEDAIQRTTGKNLTALRDLYSQIDEKDRPLLEEAHREFLYKTMPHLEDSEKASNPLARDILSTVIGHTIGEAAHDPAHDYLAPATGGRLARKARESEAAKAPKATPAPDPKKSEPPKQEAPVGPSALGLQDPPSGPEQPPKAEEPAGPQQPSGEQPTTDEGREEQQPSSDKSAAGPGANEPSAEAEQQPEPRKSQEPQAEVEDLRKIEGPSQEATEQPSQQPRFQPGSRQPVRLLDDPGDSGGGSADPHQAPSQGQQPPIGLAMRGVIPQGGGGRYERMGVPQAGWGRQPDAPLGALARVPRPELPDLGPQPIRLPDPPMEEELPEAAPEPEAPPPAEEAEAQPRQSPFGGSARKPISLPYRPWSKPAPTEEPPESPVEDRWEGLKSGERKFTAAQPMWKNLPRKPVSLPYSPWGKSGGPELPPDEDGSGSPSVPPDESTPQEGSRSGRPRNPRPLLTDPSRYNWAKPKEEPKPYDATEDETSSDYRGDYRASGGRVSGSEDESPWSRFYNKADKFFSRLSGDAKFERSPDSQPRRSSRWARSSRAPIQLPMEAPPPKPIQREGGWTPANRPTSDSFGRQTPIEVPQRPLATTMALRNKAAQRAKPPVSSPQGKPIPNWLDKRRVNLSNQDLASMVEMMLQQMRTTRWKRDDTTRTGGVAPVNTPAAAPIPSQPNEQPSLLDLARSGPTSYQYGQAPNIEGDIRTARSLNKQDPPESAHLRYVDPIGDSTPAARAGESINSEDTGEGRRSTADTMNDQSVKRPKFKKVAKEASLL